MTKPTNVQKQKRVQQVRYADVNLSGRRESGMYGRTLISERYEVRRPDGSVLVAAPFRPTRDEVRFMRDNVRGKPRLRVVHVCRWEVQS